MTSYIIKVCLNDDDPTDAAILEILSACTRGRMSAKARELMAAGIGTPKQGMIITAQVAQVPERPNLRVLPEPERKLAPIDDEAALKAASDKFLSTFG